MIRSDNSLRQLKFKNECLTEFARFVWTKSIWLSLNLGHCHWDWLSGGNLKKFLNWKKFEVCAIDTFHIIRLLPLIWLWCWWKDVIDFSGHWSVDHLKENKMCAPIVFSYLLPLESKFWPECFLESKSWP